MRPDNVLLPMDPIEIAGRNPAVEYGMLVQLAIAQPDLSVTTPDVMTNGSMTLPAYVEVVYSMQGASLDKLGIANTQPCPLVPVAGAKRINPVTLCDSRELPSGIHAPCASGDQGAAIDAKYFAAHVLKRCVGMPPSLKLLRALGVS